MRDVRVENTRWLEAVSAIEGTHPVKAVPPASTGRGLRHRTKFPAFDAWAPVVQWGLTRVIDTMPEGVRYRLKRVFRLMGPDMERIEHDYPAWIRLYDRADVKTRRAIAGELARTENPPVISVLMPVFNPSPEHLLAAICSVRDQYYPWWELCIGDDASTSRAVADILRNAATSDHRIKLVRREQNGHISAASNSALRLATGSFVALLDHDDVLPPHALYEVAARIVAQPDVDIVYSDEDHIDKAGRRSHPYFKPDWSPDLILGQNLISHLGVYRRTLVERVGGFRTGFEGSQDHDLALRVVAETRPERIAHIPKVLYHWRQGASSRTFSETAHERCVTNGRRAIHEFVIREDSGAKVGPAPVVPAWTRVVYPVPVPAPLVSVALSGNIEPNDALFDCIDGLLNRTDYPALEILVPAEVPARTVRFKEDSRVRWLSRSRESSNFAAQVARGGLLLHLDTSLSGGDPGWLREMVSHVLRPDIGAVGAKLLSPQGTVRHAGLALGGPRGVFCPFSGHHRTRVGYFGLLHLVRDVTAVSQACLLVRRDAFLGCGGFDETLELRSLRDVDLSLKLADGGYRTVWTPHAELSFKHDTVAAEGECVERSLARMRQRWKARLTSDPHWSPNLAQRSGEIGLAFPPGTDGTPVITPRGLAATRVARADAHGRSVVLARPAGRSVA